MRKLIEALHVIQEECKKHYDCTDCPMLIGHYNIRKKCIFEGVPENMDIDEVEKALL